MIGAAVVIVLAGMVIPILMLLGAVLFDLGLVTWVLFHEWHDHWSPRLVRFSKESVGDLVEHRDAGPPRHTRDVSAWIERSSRAFVSTPARASRAKAGRRAAGHPMP